MTVFHFRRLAAGLALASLVLAGCSTSPKDPAAAAQQPRGASGSSLPEGVEQLYAEAKDDMASGAWDAAIKTLERVEGRAAGTILAQQAQVDLAYAYWRSGERAQALAAIDRFIKLNPSSPALDYALYLRGVINFNDDIGVMGSLAGQDLAERDSKASRDAYQAFRQLVAQFPDSAYAEDARLRMNYILNTLAEYELHVARYYFRRGAYVAAASRAQQAVVDFDGAPATEAALFIMVQSYDRLGLDDLRDDAQRVFKMNFPDSKLTVQDLRKAGKAWWHIWN